jgi:hypothetical protein
LPPALAKNARTGHPFPDRERKKAESLGHPPWPIPANSRIPSVHGVDEYGMSYSDRFGGPAGSQIYGSASFYEGLILPSSFIIQPEGFPAGILRATTSDPNLPTGNFTLPIERFWIAH